MNAIHLLMPDGTPSKVWACAQCRYLTNDQASAESCCQPMPCRHCGQTTEKRKTAYLHDVACEECSRRIHSEEDAARMDRAEKLDAWDGWVYEWGGSGGRNGYFESLDDYVEYLEAEHEDPSEWPEFVYVADRESSPTLDADRILEGLLEGLWEGADIDDLNGVAELKKAVEAFNQANEKVILYNATGKKAIRVPRPSSPQRES
jgi:hypothetical protein